AFAWFVVPILIAYYLSRTGKFESAHLLSALSLTGLVGVAAYATGGITSFVAIWLVIIPLEAALSASRRVVALAARFALGAAGLLAFVSATGHAPTYVGIEGEQSALAMLGVALALLYATGLALSAAMLARTTFRLFSAEAERYRLLAQHTTDIITRHGR